jgi:hypothetical protein
MSLTEARWAELVSYSDTFTCYSAAMATWGAVGGDWQDLVNPGLAIVVTDAGDGIFGFAYFPPSLRASLGLERAGADDADDAVAGVLAELDRSGRVIVAGDGFRLPWHVAHERRHVPHWYVLVRGDGLVIVDAFAARNELGVQVVTRQPVAPDDLPDLLLALPPDDPVLRLREVLAFGDDTSPLPWHPYQWFVQAPVPATRAPAGASGPDALRRLARHFRERGQDPKAYVQADDIWSIGRHRALLLRRAEELAETKPELREWIAEHGAPLARRWGHVAPLLMQATLALRSGRPASSSVADVLDELADREDAAAPALPAALGRPTAPARARSA